MTYVTAPYLLEARRADSSGLVVGVVCPYGEVSATTQWAEGERFVRGAFADAVLSMKVGRRYPVVLDHDDTQEIGTVVHLEETVKGLVAGMRFRSAGMGREVANMALRHAVPLSVGFYARERTQGWDGTSVVVRAELDHVSVVGLSAYGSARTFPSEVVATRAAADPLLGSVRVHVPAGYHLGP